MCPELHPDWLNEPGERLVRINVREEMKTQNIPTMTVSRQPAAVVGVLLVLGIVVSMYGVADLFPGQTPSLPAAPTAPVEKNVIHITKTGFDPSPLTVAQGEKITWQNDSDIPHLLSSDTLKTTDGLLETPAIFSGSALDVIVSPTATTGKHVYISLTSSLSGSIIVVAAGSSASSLSSIVATKSSQSSSSQAAITSSSSSAATVSSAPLTGQVTTPQVPVIPTTPIGTVPTNPNIRGQTQTQSYSSIAGKGAVTVKKPAVTSHTPKAQPKTGPGETGALIFGSMLLLLIISRKTLSRGAWTVG